MPPIFLIRHAAVNMDVAAPAAAWKLSAAGAASAEALAELPIWGELAAVYTSPEPKARLTAAPLAERCGVPLVEQQDLGEVRRGDINIEGRPAYEAVVRAAFRDPARSINGWEPAATAQRRIVTAVKALAVSQRRPIAVVSHGLVLSLLLSHLAGRQEVDFAQWRALPLPAVALLDSDSWQVVTPFRAIDAWTDGPSRRSLQS